MYMLYLNSNNIICSMIEKVIKQTKLTITLIHVNVHVQVVVNIHIVQLHTSCQIEVHVLNVDMYYIYIIWY